MALDQIIWMFTPLGLVSVVRAMKVETVENDFQIAIECSDQANFAGMDLLTPGRAEYQR
jgi:hypothetical protein